MKDPQDWSRLVAEQDGLVTRRQALAQGLTPDDIDAHLDAARWRLRTHGVIATFTGPLTPAARRRAALLFARGAVALSHGTAAEIHGLRRLDETEPMHVTVPYGSSARGSEDVQVHRSRAFEHITVDGDLPMISKVHTVIDLAVLEPDARAAMRTMTALAAGARIPAASLVAALDLRRPRRYVRALNQAAAFLLDGVESALEIEYTVGVEVGHGLPAPLRQVPVLVHGRRRIDDLHYRMPNGVLVVRLDGWRFHANSRTAYADRSVDNASELAHQARFRFGWEEVHWEKCITALTVATRLLELGWEGQMIRCADCPPLLGDVPSIGA